MKQNILLSLFFSIVFSVSVSAQTIVLSESFEEGFPATWEQQFVSESNSWFVGSGFGAYEGNNCLILRNDTRQTIGYVSRAITPVLSLKGVFQPILCFAYSQPAWAGDVDTLRIYYKNDAKAQWRPLKEYAGVNSKWKPDTIALPGVTDYYQIAFEGIDNLGKGIYLDKVQVRSTPECTVPHDMYIKSMEQTDAVVGWLASLDANYFQVVLTTSPIDPDTIDRVPASTFLVNENMEADSLAFHVRNLTPGRTYYFYSRSLCDSEDSNWGAFSFVQKNTQSLPYCESFNFDYTSGVTSQQAGWYYYSSLGEGVPYLNTNMPAKSTESAVYSPDSTVVLAFSSANSIRTAIGAGNYAYAATPELVGEPISACNVTFQATVADFTGRNYAHAIIVGVMSDPQNLLTFEPVDTCCVWGPSTFVDHCVNLSSYKGTGRHLVFLSRFDAPNIFFIDNMCVKKRTNVEKPYYINVNPAARTAAIDWEATAPKYNVLVTSAKVQNPDNPDKSLVVVSKQVSTNSCVVEKLTPAHHINRPYYVYVQGTDGTVSSEWSTPAAFITTAEASLPIVLDMEQTNPCFIIPGSKLVCDNRINTQSNNSLAALPYPYLSNENPYAGKSALTFRKTQGCDAWVTFPLVENTPVSQMQMEFYLSGYDSYSTTHIGVGVMTNPADISTFEQVADFTCNNQEYISCFVNFDSYKGTGKYIALVWLDSKAETTTAYIDDVRIELAAACHQADNLSAVPTLNKATLTWDAGGASEWQLLVSKCYLTNGELSSSTILSNPNVVYNNPVSSSEVVIENLEPGSKYYWWVRTLCTDRSTNWSVASSFFTTCVDEVILPYVEDFERYETYNYGQPYCWSGNFGFSSNKGIDYPYLVETEQYNHTDGGKQSLYLYSYNDGGVNSFGSCAVAPVVQGSISDVRVTFFASAAAGNQQVVVGTIANDYDYSTFVPTDTFNILAKNVWYEFVAEFSNYKGTNRHVAFTTRTTGTQRVYIDDITFQTAACSKPFDFKATVTASEMNVTWRGRTLDAWEVCVTDKEVTIKNGELTGTAGAVIFEEEIEENYINLTKLNPQTQYFVYVRPTCGDMEWGFASFYTECIRIESDKGFYENFNSCKAGAYPKCWTVGNYLQPNAGAYIPYVTNPTYNFNEKAVLFNSAKNATPAWLASPEITTTDITTLAVNFTYCAASSKQVIVFGLMSDPADISTFVALDSITAELSPTTYFYDLSAYASQITDQRYLAWRTPYRQASRGFLDDVYVSTPECPTPRPHVSFLTDVSAKLYSGLRGLLPWHVIISDKPLSSSNLSDPNYVIPSDVSVVLNDTMPASVSSFALTDLISDKDYFYAISSVCDGSSSPWVCGSLHTLCAARTPEEMGVISFEDDEGFVPEFDNSDMGCWIVGNKTTSNRNYVPYIMTHAEFASSGKNALYIVSTARYDGSYAISPLIKTNDISTLSMRFYTYAITDVYDAQRLIVGIITDPNDLATFVPIDTVDGTDHPEEKVVPFYDYEGDFNGDMGKHVMFFSEFNQQNVFFVDDISFEYIPKCPVPAHVEVTGVDETTADLQWECSKKLSSFRVVMANKVVPDSLREAYTGYVIDTVVSSNKVQISGLKGGTRYYVYVQSLCGEDNVSQFSAEDVAFTTLCPATYPLPYACDFDHNSAYGKAVLPDCWTGIFYNAATDNYPCVINDEGHNGSSCLYLYSYGKSETRTYAALPAVETASLSSCRIRFYARRTVNDASHSNALILGVTSVPSLLPTSFVALDTLRVTGDDYCPFDIDLSAFADKLTGLQQLVFMTDANIDSLMYNNIYVDNVRLFACPSCNVPVLESVNCESTSATVTIKSPNTQSEQFELALMPASQLGRILVTEDIAQLATLVTSASATYTFSNLESCTQYAVFVRSRCADNTVSEWSDATLFSTSFYYKDSYKFGFEKTEKWVNILNSDILYMHPALRFGSPFDNATYSPYSIKNADYKRYSYEDFGALCFYTAKNYSSSYVIFPSIAEPKARSFSFDVRPGYANSTNRKMMSVTDGAVIAVGLVKKGCGMETYKQIAQFPLPSYSTSDIADESNDFLFQHYLINLTEEQLRDWQPVLVDVSNVSGYVCVDNVCLDEAKTWSTPLLTTLQYTDTCALIEWVNSDPVNVYVLPGENAAFEVTSPLCASYLNLTLGKLKISNLSPSSAYTIYMNSAAAPADVRYVTTVSRTFTTSCRALPLDGNGRVLFNFDENLEYAYPTSTTPSDTMFLKPACWKTFTDYANPSKAKANMYLIQRPGYGISGNPNFDVGFKDYKVGRDGSNSLRLVLTNIGYMRPYAVLPLIDCDLDTMQLSLYMRGFVHANVSGVNQPVNVSYMQVANRCAVVVGTLSSQNDLSSFVPLDTLIYAYSDITTDVNINSDPNHLEYWQHFVLPLKASYFSAEHVGRYLCFTPLTTGATYIDDVALEPYRSLLPPANLQVNDIFSTSVSVSWRRDWYPDLKTVVRLYVAETGALASVDTINPGVSHFTFSGLLASASYKWTVAKIRGSESSEESVPSSFTTRCSMIDASYTTSFELEESETYPGIPYPDYKQVVNWEYKNVGTATSWSVEFPFNQWSIELKSFAHTGEYGAKIYAEYPKYRSYLVMPPLDADLDTLQVEFWGLPGYWDPTTGKMGYDTYLQDDYTHTVEVGTCTNPNDMTTYVPLQLCTYSSVFNTTTDATETNHHMFQHFIVPLKNAVGRYVYFAAAFETDDGQEALNDCMYIDDVVFARLHACKAPLYFKVENVNPSVSTISWTSEEHAFVIEVAADGKFNNIIAADTVSQTYYTLSNLTPATSYYYRVKTIVSAERSSGWSATQMFRSMIQPYYIEDFRNSALKDQWLYSDTHASDAFTGTPLSGKNDNLLGWKRSDVTCGIEGPHYCAAFYSATYGGKHYYNRYWMISPLVHIPDTCDSHMSVLLGLTQANKDASVLNKATDALRVSAGDVFIIAVSDDGGQSWSRDNAVVFSDGTEYGEADHKLSSLPFHPTEPFVLDLSAYKGKDIRVGFYKESGEMAPTISAVHFGNVRFNTFVSRSTTLDLCPWEDASAYGMLIEGDTISSGTHVRSYSSWSSESQPVADTVYTLQATYKSAPVVEYYGVTCESHDFVEYGFNPVQNAGVYKRKLVSLVTGCDSITVLNLSVTPSVRNYTDAQICRGDNYSWRNNSYARAGVYGDTLSSVVTGCDSIEFLVLSYFDQDTIYVDTTILESALPYSYETISYPVGTAPGVYEQRISIPGSICRNIVVHKLTIVPVSAIDANAVGRQKAQKFIIRGQLYIFNNGVWFDIYGNRTICPLVK